MGRLCCFLVCAAGHRRALSLVWGGLPVPDFSSFSERSGGRRGKSSSRGVEKYERLWQDLFSNPTRWWDNRAEKPNPRFPDFKHKQSGEALWLIDERNPDWLPSEVASIPEGVSICHGAQRLAKCNQLGQYERTMDIFDQMQRQGSRIDGYMWVHVLNACAALQNLKEGRRIHRFIIETGCEMNLYVSSSLIDMYAKCGSIEDAWRAFEKMPRRNVVVWSAMILGYVKCGEGLKALGLFKQMEEGGVEPNAVTFVGLLSACASLALLDEGKRVHQHIIRSSYECDVYVNNSLVDMYAKCGSIDDAWRVFNKMPKRQVVGWNTMILGFVKCGQPLEALKLFYQMQREGVEPNSVTFVGLLNACASMGDLDEGRLVHKQIIASGCESDAYVGNSLVDMYAKCGSIDDAWRVFNKMPKRGVIDWTAMLLGFVKSGQGQKALALFQQMHQDGVEPDSVTFVAVLNACASVAALESGKRIHRQIIESGFESDLYVTSSLVDMYCKCGSLGDAERLFDKMPRRNVAAWNVMIMGYAMHGHAKEAVGVFEQMFQAGAEMNEVTFICLLSACRHGGLVKEGMQYFDSMRSLYNVTPKLEHYSCMVDLLGRAGHLDDAEEMVKRMPFETNAAVWMSLLGACRIYGNVEMGERASQKVLELEPNIASGFVLLSNIYGAAGHQDSRAIVHKQRRKTGVKKQPGQTWIEVNGEVHSFVVNDSEHPQILKIHEELTRLTEHLTEADYVPDLTFALHDVEEEKKAAHLYRHSEKLAIAFGLISTPAGSPLRIVKNLRICGDCHRAIKFISKTVGRAITARDADRFHHFKDGLCSCGDFW